MTLRQEIVLLVWLAGCTTNFGAFNKFMQFLGSRKSYLPWLTNLMLGGNNGLIRSHGCTHLSASVARSDGILAGK